MTLETLVNIGKIVTGLDLKKEPGSWANKGVRFIAKMGGLAFASVSLAGVYYMTYGSWAQESPEEVSKIYGGISTGVLLSVLCYATDWIFKTGAKMQHDQKVMEQTTRELQEKRMKLERMAATYAQQTEPTKNRGWYQSNRDTSIN